MPVAPATGPLPRDCAAVRKLAAEIGFPLMVKASWGGGGRGTRAVPRAEQLDELLTTARNEAQTAFGNDEVYLEKAISARVTSKCRSSPIRTATWCISSNATARCSGAIRRSSSARRRCS